MWSFDGVTLLHGDPADTSSAVITATGSIFKEMAVKAPFAALTLQAATALTSATLSCDVIQTAA
jgi:hypothetical protein